MNLYLDTSALVKLYIDEAGSEQVKLAIAQAQVVSTSLLAYVEARAALARKYREGGLAPADYRSTTESLDRDWEYYYAIKVSESVVKAAANLLEKSALRAPDAVHLASAKTLKEMAGISVTFLAADQHLIRAASAEGLEAVLVEV